MARYRTGYGGRNPRTGDHRASAGPCNGCGAPMVWATLTRGVRVGMDVGRVAGEARVYVLLERDGDWRVAFELHEPELELEFAELGYDLRTCHFDTCPTRKRRERADIDG